jgi:YebC/PmpR family DNA-binding regulatory protein
MSGHSKWHSIKHKKAKEDAKRGNMFGKLSRSISVAAREGGSGDPSSNIALANVISKAKEYNMPADNIERAIKKGTGEIEGVKYERIYGPAGIAIMVEIMTENKNRTAAEIRNIFSKNNGNLGESGCVSWLFEMKGIILVSKSDVENEEEFMLSVIDNGAEDIDEEDQLYEIKTLPSEFMKVKESLEKCNIGIKSSEIAYIPKTTVKLSKDDAGKALKLINILDDNDDVQSVNTNLEISDDILSKIDSQ